MKTNLITGGAGFVGSHLSELLLSKGQRVYVIDDLSTGAIRNIDSLRKNPEFHCHVDGIGNEGLLAELVDRADVVYHLAAAVGVKLIVESPVRTIETNIKGTEIVLHHAAKKKKRVLIASTSEVYGKSEAIPFREDGDMVMGPSTHGRWSYACSKAIDEFLGLAYWKEKGLPTTVVRLFNTVGPRQTGRYGMVIPRFVRQAMKGGPITVYGDGLQSRCFCDVSDVVGALAGLMEKDEAVGQIYNIGSDEEITIKGLAERVSAKFGGRVPIQYLPYDKAYEEGFEDMRRRVPELGKIQKLIGYRPTKNLDQILDRVIEYQRREEVEA